MPRAATSTHLDRAKRVLLHNRVWSRAPWLIDCATEVWHSRVLGHRSSSMQRNDGCRLALRRGCRRQLRRSCGKSPDSGVARCASAQAMKQRSCMNSSRLLAHPQRFPSSPRRSRRTHSVHVSGEPRRVRRTIRSDSARCKVALGAVPSKTRGPCLCARTLSRRRGGSCIPARARRVFNFTRQPPRATRSRAVRGAHVSTHPSSRASTLFAFRVQSRSHRLRGEQLSAGVSAPQRN